MKFGQYLQENMEPDWKEFYVDYDGLKKIIKDMSSLDVPQVARATSLSVGQAPQPSSNTEEKSQKAQGEFIDALEKDMAKIELFVVGKLQEVPRSGPSRQLQLQVVVLLPPTTTTQTEKKVRSTLISTICHRPPALAAKAANDGCSIIRLSPGESS